MLGQQERRSSLALVPTRHIAAMQKLRRCSDGGMRDLRCRGTALKPTQRAQLLDDGRKLGWEYGHEASKSGVSLVAAGRAVRFFRSQLIQAVRSEENPDHLDADDVRIQRLLDQFLDEVLFAVLGGYEQNLSKPTVDSLEV